MADKREAHAISLLQQSGDFPRMASEYALTTVQWLGDRAAQRRRAARR
jgi:hypothetical protein